MPGLLKKYAKFGFKKGWRLQKAAQRKRKSPKKATGTITRKATPKTGAKIMARKRRRGGVRRAASTVRRSVRRVRGTRTGRVVMDGVVIGGSLVGSTALINTIPFVKTQANWLKALVQLGVGIVLTNMKGDVIKKIGVGTASGAVVTVALPLVKKWMPDVALFGNNLSPEQLRSLQQMGIPYTAMGRGNNGMGMPYTPSRNGNSNANMARHASNY